MHMVMVIAMGFVAFAVFYFGAGLMGQSRTTGARVFVAVWFVASLLNAWAGVYRAGLPLGNEIAAFIPIFGIPAGVALYLSKPSQSS